MDMLDRYLQAVRFFLPADQQDDIARELSENLISQMEDREEELGRSLDESEQAEILRRHGHPMLVAGRYRSWQQLIGPVFFPLYLFSLKMGLAVALLVTVVLAIVTSAVHGDPIRHAVGAMLSFPGRALMVFAWTTLGFAALDLARGRLRLTVDWDPRSLPKVAIRDHQISRLRTLCDLVFQMAALVWFLLLPSAPVLILGPAAAIVEFSPPARMAYVPLLLVILATVALHVVDFARPYWTRSRALMRLSVGFMSLLVFAFLALADHFVSAAAVAPTFDPAATERVVGVIDASFRIGFGVAAIIATIEIVKILRRLKDLSSPPASPDSAAARAGR
jgi:hypothetical protein